MWSVSRSWEASRVCVQEHHMCVQGEALDCINIGHQFERGSRRISISDHRQAGGDCGAIAAEKLVWEFGKLVDVGAFQIYLDCFF